MKGQLLESLPTTWETQMQFQNVGFGLAVVGQLGIESTNGELNTP